MQTGMRLGALVVTMTCALIAPLSAAYAADPAAVDDAIAAQAKKLFYSGVQAYQRKDYAAARSYFSESVALVPRGTAYRNLATAEWALNRQLEALSHLKLALKAPDLPDDELPLVKRDLALAWSLTGHISVKGSRGATVRIDGVDLPERAPLSEPVDVMSGVHVVEGRVGNDVLQAEVNARPGELVEANVVMAPAQPPVPTPDAIATLPPPPAMPPEERVAVTPSFWTTRRTVGIAVAGAGLVTIGLGAIFLTEAASDRDSANGIRSGKPTSSCAMGVLANCAALDNAYSQETTNVNWAGAFAVVGASAVVTGVLLTLWPSSTLANAHVGMMLLPHGGGLRWEGDL